MIGLLRTLLLIILIIPFMSWADVLPAGVKGLRLDLGYSFAPGLWKGTEFSDFAGKGETQDLAVAYTSYFGISGDMQIDVHLEYRNRKYSSGSPEVGGTVKAGDETNTISNVGVKVHKQFIGKENYSLVGFVGFRAPGDDRRTGHFLDGTDGATKYDLGVTTRNTWGNFSANFNAMYTHRAGEHDDVLTLNLSLPYSCSHWQFGPMLTWFSTMSGTDIGDADFTNATKTTFRNFSLTKEEFMLLGLFVGAPLSPVASLDVNVQFKVSGRNTDKSTSGGLGFSYFF